MIAICLAILLFAQASEQQHVPRLYFYPTVDLFTTCNQYCIERRSPVPFSGEFDLDLNKRLMQNEPIQENPIVHIDNLLNAMNTLVDQLNVIKSTINEKLRDIHRLRSENTQT